MPASPGSVPPPHKPVGGDTTVWRSTANSVVALLRALKHWRSPRMGGKHGKRKQATSRASLRSGSVRTACDGERLAALLQMRATRMKPTGSRKPDPAATFHERKIFT